jgi:hypothetical protein|tara:strand:- start:15641 stop:15823 length:183 start_codon:yes stop_codon:yes gene_type:complete
MDTGSIFVAYVVWKAPLKLHEIFETIVTYKQKDSFHFTDLGTAQSFFLGKPKYSLKSLYL